MTGSLLIAAIACGIINRPDCHGASFSPNWYGEVRGGAFFAKGSGLTNDKTNPEMVNFNSTRYYAGLGAGYNINKNISVGLNWDYYDGSQSDKNIHLPTNLYSVSAEYRF